MSNWLELVDARVSWLILRYQIVQRKKKTVSYTTIFQELSRVMEEGKLLFSSLLVACRFFVKTHSFGRFRAYRESPLI